MGLDKNDIMSEFFRLAKEQDLLGMTKEASPSKNPKQENEKTIKEKRLKTPEKNIIEVAHPDPVYIAEARGDGGLVENQNEQQEAIIRMINKMPTGALVGRYASAANALVKLANICDDLGHTELADKLTDAAADLFAKAEQLPFDQALVSK